MIMLLRDNGNASKTQAHWSHFRGKLSFDVAIGGIIYPHVALDVSTLSCELPQFARRMANGSYTVATLSELRETCKLSPKALLTEVRAAVALRSTEDWLFYGRSPSLLPPDYFQLRPNALSLSPIASSGAPLLQQRFGVKLGKKLRSFSLFLPWVVGQPKVRLLGPAQDVVAPRREGGGLSAALSDAGLVPAFVLSVYMVEGAALVGSSLQPSAAEPQLPIALWDPSAQDAALAELLRDDVWEGTTAEELDRATLTLHSALDARGSGGGQAVVLALTMERDGKDTKLLNGAGADKSSRFSAKRASTVAWSAPHAKHAWVLPVPTDNRVQEVLSINPHVYKPMVSEPMPLVHVNPSETTGITLTLTSILIPLSPIPEPYLALTITLIGMCEVLLHDKDLLDLPQADVYAALQRGSDRGCLLNEGDILSNLRVVSVEKGAAETIIAMTDLLSDLAAGHPGRPQLLKLLYKSVETYETCKSMLTKSGDFHMAKKHCLSVVLQVVLPLGGNTLKTLFLITGVDAAVTHVNKAVSFAELYEEGLYISLFRKAQQQGKYPTALSLSVDGAMEDGREPELSAEKGQAWVLSYIKQLAESGDAVTCSSVTQLRLLHEFFELVSAQKRADMPFDEEESARFWMPLMKAAGKFHCAHSLAEKAILKLTRSGCTRAVEQLLFTHCISKFEMELEEYCEANVHNQPSDYVNERLVDMTKQAVGGFSAMLPVTADRAALSLQFYKHCHDVMLELCGTGGAGKDVSSAVPSAKMDDKLVIAEVLSIAGVWDANPHRAKLLDPLALVHYLKLHEVPIAQLIHAEFVYNEQFGLPELAPTADAAAAATAAASVAAAAPSHAASALLSMASQGCGGLQSLPAEGRVLVMVGEQRLEACAPSSLPAGRFSLAPLIEAWKLPALWRQQSESITLRTHHPHCHDTGGSLLSPLLQRVAKDSASSTEAAAVRKRETAELLHRMFAQVDLTPPGPAHPCLPRLALSSQPLPSAGAGGCTDHERDEGEGDSQSGGQRASHQPAIAPACA